jgi:hypothetical protein
MTPRRNITGALRRALLAEVRRSVGHVLVLVLSLAVPVCGQFRYVDVDEERKTGQIVVPFGFYTRNIQYAGGIGWGTLGEPQEQMALAVAGYGSSNGSWGVPVIARDVQLPFGERFFLDVTAFFADYGRFDTYRDGNPAFPLERAGSNESSRENFIDGDGRQAIVEPTFRYVLPIGSGADAAIHTYTIDDGMLVGNPMGGGPWNPFDGGRTYLEVDPFYRVETVETDDLTDSKRTNGLELSLVYDNRDFHPNPSRGSRQSVTVTRDWGCLDSSDSWTNLEFDYSKYVSLPPFAGTRQQVLAFDVWTAYTPTWKLRGTDLNGKPIYHRPPEFKGAQLGGLFRMRAFPSNRFSDKAAIYYTAEYRVMPDWNPIRSISWLDWLEVKWLQLAAFVEVGRVAPSWRIDELHRDMKWDVGIGLRVWGKGAVARADIAFAEEAAGVQVMIGHPF